MSALTNISKKINTTPRGRSNSCSRLAKFSEGFWFTFSFLLFILLGPFSAIPAFMAVLSLANEGEGREPESV